MVKVKVRGRVAEVGVVWERRERVGSDVKGGRGDDGPRVYPSATWRGR